MKTEIELHIEDLILYGFNHADRYKISDAVEQELARLINNGGLTRDLSDGINIPQLDGADIQMRHGMRAETTGTEIARSVYGAINNK